MKIIYSLFSLLLLTSFLRADLSTEEILAKAREFLGGDEALEKITSIHYEGGFETAEGESGTIDIIFEKPLKQRIRITNNGVGEITALDDFDGWRKRYDLENEDKWSLQMLDNAKIRELQANTWENLNFFKGIEERRGSIENHGKAEIDGHETVKLVFKHPASIQFTRFFDIETGRLLLTKTHE